MNLMKVYIHIIFAMLPLIQLYFSYLYIVLRLLQISEIDKAVFLLSFVLFVYDKVYQIFNTMSICSLTVVKV